MAHPPYPALVALGSHSLSAVTRSPLDASDDVMNLFDDEADRMDCWEDVVFLAASVIADALGAVSRDADDPGVILTMAADLFAARHDAYPTERMH